LPPARGLWLLHVAQPLLDDFEIEPQPAARPAEANRTEVAGMSVDPIALDAELARHGAGVDQARRSLASRAIADQLHDPLSDRLD